MTTCLVLGGADCLQGDIGAYGGPVDGVVACNDAGTVWPQQLDAWVSLHCRFFAQKGWRAKRAANGYPNALRHFGHLEAFEGTLALKAGLTADLEATDYRFPGCPNSGSSGLFAAKVALVDLGFDRAVLCGIPMEARPHFFGGEAWDFPGFRHGWLDLPDSYRARMWSMSGWTRELLGGPDQWTDETF